MSSTHDHWDNRAADATVVQRVFQKAYDGRSDARSILSEVRTAAHPGILDRGYRESLRTRVVERIKQMDQQSYTVGDVALATELEPLAEALAILDV